MISFGEVAQGLRGPRLRYCEPLPVIMPGVSGDTNKRATLGPAAEISFLELSRRLFYIQRLVKSSACFWRAS